MSPVTTLIDKEKNIEVSITNPPDRITNLAFRKSVTTEHVVQTIGQSVNPEMRFATVGEVFELLRYRNPLKKERIVCLNPKTEVGGKVIIFDRNGYSICLAQKNWDSDCRFPVAMYY